LFRALEFVVTGDGAQRRMKQGNDLRPHRSTILFWEKTARKLFLACHFSETWRN